MEEWLSPFTNCKIDDRSFLAFFKNEIRNQVRKANFSEPEVSHINSIITEITASLIEHAVSRELFYRIRKHAENTNSIFEIVAIEKSAGISAPIKDAVAKTATTEQGLDALTPPTNKSQVYTIPGWGKILYSSVGNTLSKPNSKTLNITVRAITVNKPKEVVCGDGYRYRKTESGCMVFFGDGLGHGPHAKAAVDRAGDYFLSTKHLEPVTILREMHEEIKSTRGLVGVVAVFNTQTNELSVCGVGNISTRLYSGTTYQTLMSHNGTIGRVIPGSMRVSTYLLEKNQHLIMCSDGINSRWDITNYPGIFRYDSLLATSAIYKDFYRGDDDASVLIAKIS